MADGIGDVQCELDTLCSTCDDRYELHAHDADFDALRDEYAALSVARDEIGTRPGDLVTACLPGGVGMLLERNEQNAFTRQLNAVARSAIELRKKLMLPCGRAGCSCHDFRTYGR